VQVASGLAEATPCLSVAIGTAAGLPLEQESWGAAQKHWLAWIRDSQVALLGLAQETSGDL
jgi:hypothetical protein